MTAIFTSWPFVLALALLLVNDHVLKQAYPGFVTGKLSDFAGIAVVALPLLAAFPRHARAIYLAVAGIFLWWKSPASAGFIDFVNGFAHFEIARVVDSSDLWALTILPACAAFAASVNSTHGSPGRIRRIALPPILVATVLGITGTSAVVPRKDFAVRSIEQSTPLPREGVVEVIEKTAKTHGLEKREPNPPHWVGAFSGRGVLLTYSFPSQEEVAIGIQAQTGAFGNGEVRRAEDIRKSIQQSLDLRFKGLEYVELSRDQ